MLEVHGLFAGYGQGPVLHGLDLVVKDGEFVVVLGANGAGKTTTVRAINGTISRTGSVVLDGTDITRTPPERIVRTGVAQVPQGRGTFAELSVEDNLRAGGLSRPRRDVEHDLERWYETFPRLRDRRRQRAGSLSGGEQQMLAISRALMSRPRLLLCDEPSLGLAPLVTQDLFRVLGDLNTTDGLAVLLVEQNASLALSMAHRAYVLEAGSLVVEGSAEELSRNDTVRRAYLGF